MKQLLFLILGLCLVLPACGTASTTDGTGQATLAPSPTQVPLPAATATPVPTPAGPFNYDASVPFDTRVVSETDRDGVTVVDLTYATHDPGFSTTTGGRTVAYLVKPPGQGPFAGVIFLHWLGTVSANRGEYLEEAVALAEHGVISLLPQGYFPWMSFPMGNENDHRLMLGQVIELRRAVDFLLAQPGVDPQRLGYVGHDYGALYGGVLAGIDHRLKTYILIAGTPSFADFGAFFGFPREKYLPIVQDLDPDQFVPDAAPASLLFQFGENDGVVPKDVATRYYDAASQPKKIEWYADIHDMHNDLARQARLQWLGEQLGLETPATLTEGQVRYDQKGIEQVWVPAGTFMMGTDEASIQKLKGLQPPPSGFVLGEFPSETPQHEVQLTKGYWIDKYEVTNKAFQAFIDAGGYGERSYWSEAGWNWLSQQSASQFPKYCLGNLPDNPLACVSWYEAEAYASWRGGRLPTEAEWEYAARGPQSLVYPWGNEFDSSLSNLVDSKGLKPVGSYPAGVSWVGALDMAGNVMEWVQDWLGNYSPGAVEDPSGPGTGKVKVEKGGWWSGTLFVARSAYRHFEDPPEYSDFHIGFRIVTP